MLLYAESDEVRVNRWTCIQEPLTHKISPGKALTLTPAAAIHIRELVAKQPGMVGVRLGVKQTGCAGFGYVLDSVSEPDKDDLLFEHDGAKLFVPLQAMPFIDGTEVDFVREGLNQIFKFHNPKAPE
ncbi:Fe-S cluster assembly protein [Escherichia coli]|uniref:Fe-S cluster assembly protein n=1 Tax=Escherichia coli TaxID=562 RepID=A0A2X1KGP0_ECOLX|nr:Fe-S cluster assembly protein [Escherichia coli]